MLSFSLYLVEREVFNIELLGIEQGSNARDDGGFVDCFLSMGS